MTGPLNLDHDRAYDYNSPMEKTTISQLKARLSAYLRKVRAGQTILILDRDEPVARLERVGGREAGASDQDVDDRLTRLDRAGLLRRGTRRLDVERLRTAKPRADTSLLEALVDERRAGR